MDPRAAPELSTAELYVTAGCPHRGAARDALEWRGLQFVEHDVERDPAARARLAELTGGAPVAPGPVQPGEPVEVGRGACAA